MEMITVDSTAVAAIGYDDSQDLMVVRYKNGSEYVFNNVSYDTFNHIKEASSIGRALAQSGLKGSLC